MRNKNESAASVSGLSPLALAHLRKAEWQPKRAVPTSLYEDAFHSEGLPLLPKVKTFLREFGGLIIRHVTRTRQQDVLDFLAERAVCGMGNGGIKGFEELLGVAPLCPIGHYLFGTCILLMDSRGRVFGVSDETVTFVGATGKSAISNILSGVDGEVIEPSPLEKKGRTTPQDRLS